MDSISFDDIAALRSRISGAYGPFSPAIEISQDMVNRFADLTGDHQWIHVDIERCQRESPFGAPVAHGFLTLSLLPALRPTPGFEIVGYGNVTNYGADRLRFISPVPAGSKVHARCRLVDVEAKPKGTQMTQDLAVHVVGSEKPALSYTMLMLFHHPRT